jgi:hypothetical protein
VRLSVRGLIVLVLIVGGGLGWFIHTAQVQREAVATIRRGGGQVLYDWEFRDGRPIGKPEPWWPRWLGDLIGVDYLGHPVFASLGDKATDSDLATVGRLMRLESLNLRAIDRSSSVTDDWLTHLEGLTELRSLSLSNTRVTDAGLAHVEGLTNLRQLFLIDTAVTDAGLRHLRPLRRLERVWVDGTTVTDAGMSELQQAIPQVRRGRPE